MFRFHTALDSVVGGAYLCKPQFQRFAQARAERSLTRPCRHAMAPSYSNHLGPAGDAPGAALAPSAR